MLVLTFCANFPEVCEQMRQAEMALGNQLLLDFIGYTDAKECAGGNADGCAWTIIGLIPYGKLKAGGKFGEALLDTARTGCRVSSFVSGTLVQLADGTTKSIEDVVVGDLVLATDPDSGTTAPKEVIATITSSGAKRLVKISVRSGGELSDADLTATDNHPFWSPETEVWVDAADLEPGQWLQTAGEERIQIATSQTIELITTVYNLSVAEVHTYYVLANDSPVLVHNCNPLTNSERKLLGNLVDQADMTVADVIRSRGGGAGQVKKLQTGYGELTLREIAHRAARGDREAVKALKMLKQAGSEGKGGK